MRSIALLALALAACLQEGPHAYEDATVLDLVYSPSSTGTASGFTSNGDFHVSTVQTNARYAVIFKCPHGKFVIEGDDDKHKQLWQQFSKGDNVRVEYAELLYSDGTRKGFRFYGVTKR